MSSKQDRYSELVKKRKHCKRPECRGLINQSKIDGGIYDCDQIGSWSLWQGNLDAKILVVGQDWGVVESFRELKGYPTFGEGFSKTNGNLIALLESVGITIQEFTKAEIGGPLFFTNSILCIKRGKCSDKVKQTWANICSKLFLKPLIEIIDPAIVITLSRPAYLGIRFAFDLKTSRNLSEAINYSNGIPLNEGCVLFPMYHCGGLGSANRGLKQQFRDWRKIRLYLEKTGLKEVIFEKEKGGKAQRIKVIKNPE